LNQKIPVLRCSTMILCQVCNTPNPMEADFCHKCGTKLLVLGGNQKWEDHVPPPFSLEDHFLERISNLEDTVSNILDHLTRLAETMDIVDRNGFITRSGLTSLIETLKEADQIKEDVLRERWESTIVEQMEEAQIRDRFIQLKNRFIALYRGEPDKASRFQSLIDDAEFQILSGSMDSFLDPLELALQLDYKNYELAYFMAEMAYELESGDQEIYLKIALKANPDHPDSLFMLAVVYYSQEKLKKSKKLLNRAISINQRDDASLLCLASIYTAEEAYEKARPILNRVIDINPQAQAYYLLGIGYKEQDVFKKAMTNLKMAISLDPEMEDAYHMLGFVYLRRGWTKKAKDAFSQALLLNPFKIEYQDALNFDQPKADMSLDDFDAESLELFKQAETQVSEKKYKAALANYRHLVAKFPDSPVFLCSLAVTQYSLKRWEEVIKLTQKLRELETSEIFTCIAFTLQMESERALELYDDALITLASMQSSLQADYGQAIASYGIALTLADVGEELKTAEKIATTALDFAPEEFVANILDALGWVYFKQGKLEESLIHLEKALKLNETVLILQHYGLTLLSLNLQDKALDVFAKLLEKRGQEPQVDQFIFRALEKESKQIKPTLLEEKNRVEK